MRKTIHYIDMFAGMGGFREGLTRAGDFVCMGHCEIDKYADRSYRALFDTEGEWFIDDARKADPDTMPDFELLCGGFPCQAFSLAGNRRGFGDPRGTLFFELARLAEARKPRYLLFENVPGLLSHNGGRTFATILHTLDRLGYGVEWQVLNSKDFGVPQSRRRVYIVGYLDERCRGKILPFTDTTGNALAQIRRGAQGERVYSPEGVSCTLAAQAGGFGGRTGLYAVGLPIKEVTRKGYKMAYEGDSIDISYYSTNTRRGRVGHKIAHTLTTGATQGALCFIDMNRNPKTTEIARSGGLQQTFGCGYQRGSGPCQEIQQGPYHTGWRFARCREGGSPHRLIGEGTASHLLADGFASIAFGYPNAELLGHTPNPRRPARAVPRYIWKGIGENHEWI